VTAARNLIHGATVVTVDTTDRVLHDDAIVIDGDRIAAMESSTDMLARYPDAERIDGAGKVVMPGFANIHTHFVLTLARGVFEDQSLSHKPPFAENKGRLPLPKLGAEERPVMAQLGALEALESGAMHS
jgi:5-methylthioadenosine/S-adenosylhomocysteine deaminase